MRKTGGKREGKTNSSIPPSSFSKPGKRRKVCRPSRAKNGEERGRGRGILLFV